MRRFLVVAAALAACMTGCGDDAVEPESSRITISVSGDILIHDPVFRRADRNAPGEGYDFEPMFAPIRSVIEGADLSFCHAETPITDLGPPTGFPIFNSPPELADAVAATGWDACSLASNHSLDQGQAGIAAFTGQLDRVGVAHTGIYTSAEARSEPLILEAEGLRVALLSYTTNTNNHPLPHPYSVNLARKPATVIADARRAREAGADAVIVNLHWTLHPLLRAQLKAFPQGSDIAPEHVSEPSPAQVDYVRALLRAEEITTVVAQGPHVVQPILRVAGKYAIFSEGNLISSQRPSRGFAPASQDGLIAYLDLRSDSNGAVVTGIRYVPIWVRPSDHAVLPVGDAIEGGLARRSELRASYERTVSVAGRGDGIEPLPAELP